MKATKEALDAIDAARRDGRVTERVAGPIAEASAGRRWTFTLPNYHPARLNELMGCHWAKAARRKKADRNMIARHAALAGVPRATCKRRVTLKIVLAKGQRGGDPDCFFKSLLDGMTHAGIITDDNRFGVELMPVEYERWAMKSTVITLEDI